jgi:N-acyl-phosphatidylethanolamine-hydrolysing phospholipase D
VAAEDDALRKRFGQVVWEWLATPRVPDPAPGDLEAVPAEPARPTAGEEDLLVTWVGHTTFLVQIRGFNLLTDPVWSRRVSPVPFLGPRRFVRAVPALDELPPIHAVLLSHDHFDHLDRSTVRALNRRFGSALRWLTPLGYRDWFGRLGIRNVTELDWWEEADVGPGALRVIAAPARHWTRRTPWGTNRRLWCSWAVIPRDGSGPRVCFVGDSGYAPCFSEVGDRLGPFDASLVPIGAYEPRWFMAPSHMDPEEAVLTYRDLGGRGIFIPSHWGTFRLTFEPPLEPPARLLEAWSSANLPDRNLVIPRHGETVTVAEPS